MAEFMVFVCAECGQSAKVRLENGDVEKWKMGEGCKICAECFEKFIRPERQ